jgi:hypothetical protein
MTWLCSIVQSHRDAKQPGHIWQAQNGHWLVLLPNGGVHDINGISEQGSPWLVIGQAPNLTVSPSIDYKIKGTDKPNIKGWHGYIQNGVISDDCEGRTY